MGDFGAPVASVEEFISGERFTVALLGYPRLKRRLRDHLQLERTLHLRC